MNVSGEFTVKAPRQVVFETLRDELIVLLEDHDADQQFGFRLFQRHDPAFERSGTLWQYRRQSWKINGLTQAIDGKKGDVKNGWAIGSKAGVPHYAAFALQNPIGDAQKGVRLRFELNQQGGNLWIWHGRL